MAAIATIGSHFMQGTGTGTLTWAELFKFKTDPTLINAPELLDTTTQADHARTSIFGLAANDQAVHLQLRFDVRHHQGRRSGTQPVHVVRYLQQFHQHLHPRGSFGKFTGKGYCTSLRTAAT